MKYGEFGAEPGQLFKVKLCAYHLGALICLDKSLTVRTYYGTMTGIEPEFIAAAAVYAYGKALVLNGSGTQ